MKRLLIVDDSPLETKLLLGIFRGFGAREFEIDTAARLDDAIEIARSRDIDVVLLDLVLHDSNGLETLLRMRDAAPEVAIVVTTAIEDEAQAIEALKNGAQDYLTKANVTRDMLFRVMRYAIERKKAETERRLLEQRLLEAQKLEAIGTLARGVAHNFNNMLTSILGRSQMILQNAGDDDHHHVVAIKKSAERAAQLTRQLMTFSRRTTQELLTLNLNQVIADIGILLESILANEAILDLQLAPVPATIKANRQQIGQVLMNLVINAHAAMPAGGTCVIATCVDNDRVILTVSDNGCGIPAEALPRIFEPFFTTKGLAGGSGLGLSVVYGIIAQHGGTIEVASSAGEGTTFTMSFPLLREAREERSAIVSQECRTSK